MDKHLILLIHVTNRIKNVPELQEIFTRYGNNIRTRLGLHEVGADYSSKAGVIVLDMVGEESRFDAMAREAGEIEGVEVQKVVFSHT